MPNRRGWLDFYGRPLSLKRYLWRILNHVEFLYNIIQLRPKYAIEIGIGTASHSFFVGHFTPFVVGIDNDFQIVKSAKESSKRFGKRARFIVADAFNLPFKKSSFDLCFSQGFFEHFNDKEINSLIDEQLKTADSIIFSVPSYNYQSKDFGNERLLKREEWLELLKLVGGKERFIVRTKYSVVDMKPLGVLMIKNYCIGALEVITFIKKLCKRK